MQLQISLCVFHREYIYIYILNVGRSSPVSRTGSVILSPQRGTKVQEREHLCILDATAGTSGERQQGRLRSPSVPPFFTSPLLRRSPGVSLPTLDLFLRLQDYYG